MQAAHTRQEAKAAAKKTKLIGGIADVLLADGVAQIPLRDLAVRLGTSDRMLLYYFSDKAELIRASIAELAVRLGAVLADQRVEGRRSPAEVMTSTAAFMQLPGIVPFRAVWADILARGGRGEAPFDDLARALVDGAIDSIDARLAIADAAERRRMAGTILAAIEGVWLISMVAPGSAEGAIERLAAGLG